MNDPGRRETEDLLRHALNDAAARIHPAGDGLERIRERAARRRRRLGWSRPILAVATGTAAVALAATVPLYLHSTGDGDTSALNSASGTEHAATLTGTPTDPPSSTPTQSPEPRQPKVSEATTAGPGTALPDMTTVWPYGSRGEGGKRADRDVADHTHPQLRNPRQTALEFIKSFVGTTDDLVADDDAPLAAGIGVTVSRMADDGTREPVSLVYLVRVRTGDDAPYVVVDASRPPLDGAIDSLSVQPGELAGAAPIMVNGAVTEPVAPQPVASVKVELREPGRDQTLASQSPALVPDPDKDQQTWTAVLTPIRPLDGPTGTVAAWTVDAQNHLLAFAAAPTATGPSPPSKSGD